MKVLFIMNGNFSSHSTSEHLLTAVLEQLVLGNHQVHVVQMLKPGDTLSLPVSVNTPNITTEGISVIQQKKSNLVARYINANRNYLKCRSAIKAHSDSDAVFLQSTNAAGIAVFLIRRYLKKARITYNVQDVFPYNAAFAGNLDRNSYIFRVLSAIQRYGYKHSDRVITISEDMKDTLVSDGILPEKIEVIYNWSYQDELYNHLDLTPVNHMFNKNYFNVVYAGNIGVMQNVDILIKTAKLLKGDLTIWFHVIGDGVYKEKLEIKAKEYGIENIAFWPMQPPELAPLIYSAADVNIIPLVKDIFRTALPSKTATCLACQKPIVFAIGKDSKFGKKIQERTSCIVTDCNRPDEIVKAILKLKNKEIRTNTAEFFMNECNKTGNSACYARIIVGEKS